jgi:type IV secretory pathway VirB10-like protein
VPEQNASTGSVPEIQNKSVKPAGVTSKHRQTMIMLAVGGLIVLVISFSNSSPDKPKTRTNGGSNPVTPTSPKTAQEYARQLDDEARGLAQERARAEQMKAEAQRLQAGQQSPYENPYQAPSAAANAGGQAGHQLTPEEADRIERRKREENALRASNVALTFRKDQGAALGSGTSSPASDLSDIRQLIEAQKAQLRASLDAETTAVKPLVSDRPLPTTAPQLVKSATEGEETETRKKQPESPDLQKAVGKPFKVFEGTLIETVLTNRLNGTFSGPVDVQVTTAVYSHDRQHVLIPQGSRIVGEVQKVSTTGQQRLAVIFHRLLMPDGYAVSLDQFKGLNQIGETGLKDQVNQHYVQIFGASLALGAIAGVEQAGASYGYNTSGVDMYRQGVAESLPSSATRILDRFLNTLPTITIREGHRVKVYLTGDLTLPAYENHRIAGDI